MKKCRKNKRRKTTILPSNEEASPVTIDILTKNPEWEDQFRDCGTLIETIAIATLTATSFLPAAHICELSVVLADDPFIQNLNKEYRGKDAPTNVLSFPSDQLTAGDYSMIRQRHELIVLGDVILSLDTLKREALAANKPLRDHLTHLLVHGILHVLGYDHETDEDAALMEKKEIEILYGIGIDSPYEAC